MSALLSTLRGAGFFGALAFGLTISTSAHARPDDNQAGPPSSTKAVVRFEVVGETAPVTLRDVTGDVTGPHGGGYVYNEICTAPCTSELTAGPHRLLLSRAWPLPRDPFRVTLPSGTSTVRASVTNHDRARTAGALVLLGGIVGGLTLGIGGALATESPSTPLLVASPVVLIAGTLGGLALLLTNDEARVDVLPGVLLPASGANGGPTSTSLARPTPEGFTVRVRF